MKHEATLRKIRKFGHKADFAAMVAVNWQPRAGKKLDAMLRLLTAGVQVHVADGDIDRIMIDGVIREWEDLA